MNAIKEQIFVQECEIIAKLFSLAATRFAAGFRIFHVTAANNFHLRVVPFQLFKHVFSIEALSPGTFALFK